MRIILPSVGKFIQVIYPEVFLISFKQHNPVFKVYFTGASEFEIIRVGFYF